MEICFPTHHKKRDGWGTLALVEGGSEGQRIKRIRFGNDNRNGNDSWIFVIPTLNDIGRR